MGLNRLSVKLMIGYTTSSVEQRNRVIARNQDSQFGVVTKSDALVPFFPFPFTCRGVTLESQPFKIYFGKSFSTLAMQ